MSKLVLKVGPVSGKDLNPRNYRRIKRACSHPNCAVEVCKYDYASSEGAHRVPHAAQTQAVAIAPTVAEMVAGRLTPRDTEAG